MDKESINKRFIKCVNHVLKVDKTTTKTTISEFMNIKPNTFSEILNSRMNIATDHIANFIAFRPEISAEWILTGSGTMLKSKSEEDKNEPGDSLFKIDNIKDVIDLATQLGMQIKENENLHQKNMELLAENKRLKNKSEDNVRKVPVSTTKYTSEHRPDIAAEP